MSDVKWLTYDELAAVLRIAPDSARRLVSRKKWARRPGNDGKARIGVPHDVIPDVTPAMPPDIRGDIAPDKPDATRAALDVLSRHIERLEGELVTVKAERDQARATAVQVEALRATVAVLEGERDRWHQAATAPRGLARFWR